MKKPAFIIPVFLFVCSVASAQSWKSTTFHGSVEDVYSAAEKSVTKMHEVKSKDSTLHIVRFHVGTTAWSWGYNMSLAVENAGDGVSRATVEIEKSGGPAFSWGSGKKEVGKIFKQMQKELSVKNQITEQTVAEAKQSKTAPSPEPSAAIPL